MKLRAGDLRDSLEKQIANYKSEMKIVKQYEKKQEVSLRFNVITTFILLMKQI